MLNLPRTTFNKIKRTLLRQQKEIEQEIKSMEKDDPLNGDSLAESSEPGTDSWMADMHSRTIAIKNNLTQILSKTRKAITNINSGKYGKCENCGQPIEVKRLEAMPTATLCMACSKKLKK